jgi:hypothetical protein
LKDLQSISQPFISNKDITTEISILFLIAIHSQILHFTVVSRFHNDQFARLLFQTHKKKMAKAMPTTK